MLIFAYWLLFFADKWKYRSSASLDRLSHFFTTSYVICAHVTLSSGHGQSPIKTPRNTSNADPIGYDESHRQRLIPSTYQESCYKDQQQTICHYWFRFFCQRLSIAGTLPDGAFSSRHRYSVISAGGLSYDTKKIGDDWNYRFEFLPLLCYIVCFDFS